MTPPTYFTVEELKALRVQCDTLYRVISAGGKEGTSPQDHELYSMAAYQVMVSLINSKMWLGKIIEALQGPLPSNLADNAPVPSSGTYTPPTGGTTTAPAAGTDTGSVTP